MIHLIKGRYDIPAAPISPAAFQAANTDVFEGLSMPKLRAGLKLVSGSREQIAHKVAEEAAASLGDLFHGNFRNGFSSLAKAFAGGAGMIAGAMIGTAVGGGVGSIIGMTIGGALFQLLAERLLPSAATAAV